MRLTKENPSIMETRTSKTHPLRIDSLPAGESGGRIGITFCPGKCGPSNGWHRWERSLRADLDAVAKWGPTAVVTLIEDHEFRMLGVPGLGRAILARGIEWHHLPIVDVRAPDERFERAWREVGPGLQRRLRDGERILIHCRGGLGRAGTVAALLLVDMGEEPDDAVRRVRDARPGAIETSRQLRYVMDWQHLAEA